MNKNVLYTIHGGVMGKRCYRSIKALKTAVKNLKHGIIDGGVVDGVYYMNQSTFLKALFAK